jgi:hypothetical protein
MTASLTGPLAYYNTLNSGESETAGLRQCGPPVGGGRLFQYLLPVPLLIWPRGGVHRTKVLADDRPSLRAWAAMDPVGLGNQGVRSSFPQMPWKRSAVH